MKKNSVLREILLVLSLFLIISVSLFVVSCNSDDKARTDDTTVPSGDGEEQAVTKADGGLEFTALGIGKYDEFDGKTPSDENKIFVIYIEVRNESEVRKYLHKNYFDYRFSDNELEIENYPEGYSAPEGFIESGMRKKIAFAFEADDKWKYFDVEYESIWFSTTSYADYVSSDREETPKRMEFYREGCESGIAEGDSRFPIDTTDYSYVTEQFVSYFKKSMFGDSVNKDEGMRLLDSMKVNEQGGYWEDIDYNSGADGKPYPEGHIYRIQDICRYFGEEGLAELSDEDKEKINLAVEFWLNGKYRLVASEEDVIKEKTEGIAANYDQTNWSYNDFHTPRRLFPILIMFGEYMHEEDIERMLIQSPHCLFPQNDIYWRGLHTCSNLCNFLRSSLYYAAYSADIGMACTIAEHLFNDIHILSENDVSFLLKGYYDGGIAPDGSVYEHAIAYGAGYGVEYTVYLAEMLTALKESMSIEPDTTVIDTLSYYVTTSYKMSAGGLYGNMIAGRTLCCYSPGGAYDSGLNTLATALLKFDNCTRREELQYVLDNYFNNSERTSGKYSAYFFYNALISSMKTENVTMNARGSRNDMSCLEGGTDMNCLCRNLMYGGQTEFLYTGSEYFGIASLWDWSLVPGTTAFYETDEELFAWTEAQNGSWINCFATKGTYSDGASDDKASVVYVGVENEEGLTALKTDVSYNGIVVCLGADITCTAKNNVKEINTAIEQCFYVDATYNGESLYEKEIEITDDKAVRNGAFAYYNLGEGKMLAKANAVDGHIRRVYSTSYTDPETHADLFTLWIPHGDDVDGASYAYAAIDNSKGDAPESGSELPIKQITNTKEIQAVEFEDGTVVAVFHDTTKALTTTDGRTLSGTEENRAVIVHG